jgi:hypothetical protein
MKIVFPLQGKFLVLVAIVILGLFMTACTPATQDRASDAINAAPVPSNQGENDFRERKNVILADQIRNRDDVIFFAYHLADDGQLIDQWTCLGTPVSSTESVEPNTSYTTSGMGYAWTIPLEGGQTGYTTEMMGIDGTYSDPVPFLFCITPTGQYEQWSVFDKVRVTTMPRSYPQRLVQIDEAQWARVQLAEAILARGGCVDEALNEMDCTVFTQNIEGAK